MVFFDFYGIYIFYRDRRRERKGEKRREYTLFVIFRFDSFIEFQSRLKPSTGIFYQVGGSKYFET
jgi:hypothetical protein